MLPEITGLTLFFAAAAIGLSALLVSSALAFNIVKYVGAAYLIYLGICKLLEREGVTPRPDEVHRQLARLFYEGMIVNILNPKTALFFFAFLPQFVEASRGGVAGQVLILGSLFVLMGIVSDAIWALLAGSAGDWLRNHRGFLRSQRYFAGTVFIALGITTAQYGSKDR